MIVFKTLFLKFLLLPLITFLLLGVMMFVQKKNALANNKVLIIYLLLAALVLALPGLAGLAGNTFNPYWYLFAQIFYVCLGALHVNLMAIYFKKEANKKIIALIFECLFTLIIMVAGTYLFTVIFNLVSPYDGYSWMAATAIFIFPVPLLFFYTWLRFTAIPVDIYKVWNYIDEKNSEEFTGLNFDKLMVINVDFTKSLNDGERFTVGAKSPGGILLGKWFHKFIEDYNKKSLGSPIQTGSEKDGNFSWIFYAKPSFFQKRKYFDFDKTIEENKIDKTVKIICKRVIQQQEEKFPDEKISRSL